MNFADDAINPAELGVMDRMITQVKNGRAVLLPASDVSKGHQTLSEPALWTEHVWDLLNRSRPKADGIRDAR